jgi:hypothetical protein
MNKPTYLFSRYLSKDEKKWILECIDYVKSLNIPISNNIYFKHCYNFTESGWCETEEDSIKAECTIAISKYLNYYPDSFEQTFKEVCIHELLHTIKNQNLKNPHKGVWGKYAKMINSLYKFDAPIHRYYIDEKFYPNHLKRAKADRYKKTKAN